MTPLGTKRTAYDDFLETKPKFQRTDPLLEQVFNYEQIVATIEKMLEAEFYTALATTSSYFHGIAVGRKIKRLETVPAQWFKEGLWMKDPKCFFYKWKIESLICFKESLGAKLTSLNLIGFGSKITDQVITDLLPHCTHPSFVSLAIESKTITDEGVKTIAKTIPGLKSFVLYNCEQITDRSLILLGMYCKTIESVCIPCDETFTTENHVEVLHYHKISFVGLTALATAVTTLKNLEVSLVEPETELKNFSLRTLAESNKSLEILSINFKAPIAAKEFRALAQLTTLRSLDLDKCSKLVDEDLEVTLPHLTQLTHLVLWNTEKLTPKFLTTIMTYQKELEVLILNIENADDNVDFYKYESKIEHELPKLKRVDFY